MSDTANWDLTLPEGARVAPLTEQPAGSASDDLLGASGVPGGVAIYGGTDLHAYGSADGTLWVVYCGERGAGHKFGTYVLRYFPDGRKEFVDYGSFTEGRVGVAREPDGLYLAWPLADGRSWERVKVPGYVTPGWPTSGQQVMAPVSITTAPAATSLAAADQGARDQVAGLKKTVDRLAKQVAELAARPAGAAQVDVGQIRDVIWNLPVVVDRVYASLAENNEGLVGQIRRIVADTVRAMKGRGEI